MEEEGLKEDLAATGARERHETAQSRWLATAEGKSAGWEQPNGNELRRERDRAQ